MSGKKRYILYAVYLAAAAVLFLYARFPADTIAGYISGSVSSRNPELQVDIESVAPALPLAVMLRSIAMQYRELPVFDAQSARVTPVLFSLLGDSKKVKFKVQTGGGIIKGQANLASGQSDQQMSVKADLANIQLQELSAVKTYIRHSIQGQLSGEVDLNGLDTMAKADAKLQVNGFKIQLNEPILGMESFEFKKINATISGTPSRVQLKKCTFDGRDMDGEINGTVSMRVPLENSILNFSGVIRPHPEFIARLSTTVPAGLLSPGTLGKSGIPFRIRGTIGEPGYSLR